MIFRFINNVDDRTYLALRQRDDLVASEYSRSSLKYCILAYPGLEARALGQSIHVSNLQAPKSYNPKH